MVIYPFHSQWVSGTNWFFFRSGSGKFQAWRPDKKGFGYLRVWSGNPNGWSFRWFEAASFIVCTQRRRETPNFRVIVFVSEPHNLPKPAFKAQILTLPMPLGCVSEGVVSWNTSKSQFLWEKLLLWRYPIFRQTTWTRLGCLEPFVASLLAPVLCQAGVVTGDLAWALLQHAKETRRHGIFF